MLHRLGVLGAVAILPAVAQVYSAPISPQAKVGARRHRHGPARDVRVSPDGSITSTSWSGYVVDGANGSVTDVKGSWTVPAVICSGSGSTSSSFWVGIDGYPSTTVEQVGTHSDCASGAPSYYAWFEFYPSPEIPFSGLTIQPGDQVSAEVSFSGGWFNVTITDEATGESSFTTTTFPSALRSSAEWIAEDPEDLNHNLLPFANFGMVAFGFDNTGVTNTCSATVGKKTGVIGSFPFTSFTILNGATEAVPSALWADGSSFQITTNQTFTTLANFNGTNDGAGPSSLVQGMDGNFYGTTGNRGANGYGTVFKITPGGTLTTLHSFNSTDGAYPLAGLVQGINGNFYGTTSLGGAYNCGAYNQCGTIFKITPGGTLTTLHSFNSTDGYYPVGGLVQGLNGNFYGTTSSGGANNYGTVFKITPGGALTTLHSFNSTDGANTWAGLVQGLNGNFYGTTQQGGTSNLGTVFNITPGGTLTTLHSFNSTDGAYPLAGLVQGLNGNFYGTTSSGGANNYGTVFKITPGGTLTTLHSFNSTDGYSPSAGLVLATNGSFYGTTQQGGTSKYGTVSSLL